MSQEKIVERIRKLLAFGKSPNEAEALQAIAFGLGSALAHFV